MEFLHLRNIAELQQPMTQQVPKIQMNAFISSRPDNCNAIFNGFLVRDWILKNKGYGNIRNKQATSSGLGGLIRLGTVGPIKKQLHNSHLVLIRISLNCDYCKSFFPMSNIHIKPVRRAQRENDQMWNNKHCSNSGRKCCSSSKENKW